MTLYGSLKSQSFKQWELVQREVTFVLNLFYSNDLFYGNLECNYVQNKTKMEQRRYQNGKKLGFCSNEKEIHLKKENFRDQ